MSPFKFGIDTFQDWYNWKHPQKPGVISWGPTPIELSKGGMGIYDHGFLTDCMPVFTGLDGNEMCIISRTYATDEVIDNPPEGVKHLRFPELMGEGDCGQAIITYITGKGPGAIEFLSHCGNVRAKELPLCLPLSMTEQGYQVIMTPTYGQFGWGSEAIVAQMLNPPTPDLSAMLDCELEQYGDLTLQEVSLSLGSYLSSRPKELEWFLDGVREHARYFSSPDEMAADAAGQPWPPLAA